MRAKYESNYLVMVPQPIAACRIPYKNESMSQIILHESRGIDREVSLVYLFIGDEVSDNIIRWAARCPL